VISALLQFLPLTNTTGFEFSFILSIPLFISGGLIAIVNPAFKIKVNSIILILFVPFTISIVSNLVFSICPISSDFLFYFVISIPAFIVGYLWGVFIYNNTPFVRLGYFLVSLQILLMFSLAEFYFLPQIYFYNPVFGYLPGTIYDQHIGLSWSLVFYRLLIILFFYLFSKMRCSGKENTYWSLVTIPLFLGVWFILVKPWLGYSTTEGHIEGELNQVFKIDHFQIYTDSQIKYDSTSLKDLHEFYYEEIKTQLNLKKDISIKSYIFKNKQQKKRLFGSENADVAKPWLKQIYVDENNFTRSLKHELVHIMAGQFGAKPFDVAAFISPSLIEGMAMAVENNYDDKEIDYIVTLAIESGYRTDLKSLFTGLSFFGSASSKSYLFAGSFIKYLMNTYGVEKVKKLYKDGGFTHIYGKSIEELEKEFNKYLFSLNFKSNDQTANLYFGYKPLINKICPRISARIEREGWELYQSKNYDAALNKFEFIFNATGSYSSLNGILLTEIQQEQYKKAFKMAEENLLVFNNTSYFYNLELRVADLSILNSDSLRAAEVIDNLLEQNPSINYYNEAVFRNLLLTKGLEYYANFLLGDYQKKILLLKDFSGENGFDSVVQEIIDYSRNIDEGIEAVENITSRYLPTLSREGIYTAYKLSEYFYSKGLLNEANKYSEFAYNENTYPEFESTISENYRLINWSLAHRKSELSR